MFKDNSEKSFTLIETLLVITIMGVLFSIVSLAIRSAINKAYHARIMAETKALSTALEMYLMDNDYKYPCDVNRDLPSGLEQYLSTNPLWPKAPWPGSVYDWDYWRSDQSAGGCRNPNESPPSCTSYCYSGESPPCASYCAGTLSYNPKTEPVYQLSIRFCDIGGGNCRFPNEEWAINFDSSSSAYWCILGPCRAHGSQPYDHAGCCIGGACPADRPRCELK